MISRIPNSRKQWLTIGAAVALLAVGLFSGVAFATNSPTAGITSGIHQDNGYSHGEGRHGGVSDNIMTRVAEILDVEPETLENAFTTAYDEEAESIFDTRIGGLVDNETITQEQADEATSWFEDRPALSGPLAIRLAWVADGEKVDGLLDKLVERSKLTQEEADALSDWHDDRPDFLPEMDRGRKSHHGDGDKGNGRG